VVAVAAEVVVLLDQYLPKSMVVMAVATLELQAHWRRAVLVELE
jgi:hypothetical protein